MTRFDRRAFLGMAPAAALLPASLRAQTLNPTPLAKGETRSVKVAVGGIADITHLAVWYAKFGGFFDALKADGIDVEVVPFGGGSEWLLALTSGQVQMAHGYFENGVRARSQGRDIVLIDNILPSPVFKAVIRADLADQIRSPADAKGHSWGITSFGSASHVVSMRVVSHFNVAPASVRWTGIGGTAGYLPSIREKRVDILTTSIKDAALLIEEGSGKLLQDITSAQSVAEIYGHPYIGPGMLASHAYCDKDPYVVMKVLGAVRKAIAAARSTPAADVAAKLPAEFQSGPVAEAVGQIAQTFAKDGTVQLDAATAMVRDMSDLKLGRGGIEPADTFDNRFIQAVNAGS
jgi:NitT/TauT family transport system substrate-binding protein